jgi:hypothetical protein
MVLDDLFSPADVNTEFGPYMELEPGSTIAEPDDFTYLGMDPNIFDTELPEDVSSPVEYDSSSDSDSDSATAELHPILDMPLETPTDESDTAELYPAQCYIFLTYHCAHNGLSLGPSLYFVIYSHHAQTMTHCYLS